MAQDPGDGAGRVRTAEPVRRPIKSFVRRAGRTTAGQRLARERLWPTYGIDFRPAPLDLEAIFGRTAERVLEIGFGDGESLVRQASERPEVDHIGIEVHPPGVGHCLLLAESGAVSNLRVIAHDAMEVLEHQLPRESLHRINLWFPDPWPKKRHRKRRLVEPRFAELAARCLMPDGRLYVATDWPDYAEQIDEVFQANRSFALHTRREHRGDRPLERATTKFERRALKLGHGIVDWRFDRIHCDP